MQNQNTLLLRTLNHHRRLLHCTQSQSQLFHRPIRPSTCISLIKQCNTLQSLKAVHASILRTYLHFNIFFCTNLIAHYASLGSTSHAYTLFSAFSSSDVFLWNVIIKGFVDNGLYNRAIALYSQMWELGVHPDHFTFPFVLKACGYVCDHKVGVKVHGDVIQCGYAADLFVGNSLIALYGKLGQIEAARKVFDKIPDRTVVSWSSMIGAYAQNGYFEEGLFLFVMMLNDRLRPNRAAILNVMACVLRSKEADEVCAVLIDNGLQFDRSVQNAAMQMYARCGRIDVARGFFNGIIDKDLVSWASMIEAYAQVNLPLEALELFKSMMVQRIRPDLVALLSVIRTCSNLASYKKARWIHGVVIRSFFGHHVTLETSLVDLYVKCGSLVYARKVFDKMQERNIISWSTMISGYGMHGHGREAVNLFHQMKAPTKPDHVAFLSVLSACSHGGLIAEGWDCFNSMGRDFHIIPRPEHYACMVDLLGRSGRLNEAFEFIERMPVRPDAGVWGALLGACRIHSNIELAKTAAKNLFELDAENPGRYVLMSNIYASSGKQKDADKIRDLMKQRGVRKVAGHTSIEIRNKVYTFVAGDKSHAQSDLIYSELEKVINRIRQEGYKPDLNFVLHDVEEEMKETMLYVHSEKLAIVFGLLNSGPGSVIRINKNLRVCGDCHTASKFISKVMGREIVMRDAHRFHHFNNGACSCGDYW
ncbi:putative tetratricopeptide-like helical domain, DYW domain-containing protein [Rosa chinensis]|uniref:Putative tetratricopeptide-like helical domain, DYW domain-containing protein n=1 Tax=Rosa chinensis TaxID=74649 RepID=A0A2P6RU01_ROSCH|nr:pentatricopeptide repeat-containing protein At3g26782, mitochondrial [Rosa chinensis]PRQ49917.1 putative tetratricopeptide-like helical domain, DYW domain-containing protein [Rosa chinensis]